MRSRVTADDVHDGLTTAVLALDDRLQISTVNAAAEGLFEISRRLALGTPLREAIVPFAPHERRLRDALDSRSEEHTSELQSLMRISYAVFCLKKKKSKNANTDNNDTETHDEPI